MKNRTLDIIMGGFVSFAAAGVIWYAVEGATYNSQMEELLDMHRIKGKPVAEEYANNQIKDAFNINGKYFGANRACDNYLKLKPPSGFQVVPATK